MLGPAQEDTWFTWGISLISYKKSLVRLKTGKNVLLNCHLNWKQRTQKAHDVFIMCMMNHIRKNETGHLQSRNCVFSVITVRQPWQIFQPHRYFIFPVFLLNIKLLQKKIALRMDRILPCQGSILEQCKLTKGAVSCRSWCCCRELQSDAYVYSPSCLPRMPTPRKHCECSASPWWLVEHDEHEVSNPLEQ